MVFKKKTAAAQAPTEAVRPDYVKVGRCAITYLPTDSVKPIFRGYMYMEEQDEDGDTIATTYFITAFKTNKAGSKAIASGTVKLSEDKDCPVSFYISIMEGKDDSLYALMNPPKEEQDGEPPIKLALFDTDHDYYFTGLVSVPVPF